MEYKKHIAFIERRLFAAEPEDVPYSPVID